MLADVLFPEPLFHMPQYCEHSSTNTSLLMVAQQLRCPSNWHSMGIQSGLPKLAQFNSQGDYFKFLSKGSAWFCFKWRDVTIVVYSLMLSAIVNLFQLHFNDAFSPLVSIPAWMQKTHSTGDRIFIHQTQGCCIIINMREMLEAVLHILCTGCDSYIACFCSLWIWGYPLALPFVMGQEAAEHFLIRPYLQLTQNQWSY